MRSTEITVYKTKTVDKEGEETEVEVNRDDGAREGVTVEKLAKLKPAF
jgi:acetyl-CoA acyltransferase 1